MKPVSISSDYYYKVVELKREIEILVEGNKRLQTYIKGALAALCQTKTFPADIEAAKDFLKSALNLEE